MTWTRWAASVLAAAHGVALLAGLAFLDHYTWFENTETNHTSIPITAMFALYVVTMMAALVLVRRRRGGLVDLRVAWFVLIVSVIGVANIGVFDVCDVMMEKHRWFSKGMPDRP